MFTLARVAAGVVVSRFGSVPLSRASAAGVAAGVLLFAFAPSGAPLAGAAGLWLVGFALGPLFPGLMAETPRRLGSGAATHAVGFQVAAAVVGAAAAPALAGALAARGFGLDAVPAVLVAAAVLFLALHERIVAATDRG
jgi:fucose permease